ncbi:putative transmembrane efflux protein [Diplodia seriata]|uniref:Putative transmembrane efflux protein n=1 Tax=Diplodia seriata TaxID=420778 RepID=A0A0G2GX96_9PEZI|nr:putative transmembrane efflux protein [Diplodia seriata]
MTILERLKSMPDSMASCNPNYILAVVCSAMFLDLANLSAITIALPTIQENFNVDVGNLQWMISAYALTFGGFLLLGGRGGDIFGHRRVLLFGMVFFALFSLVCALSPTFIGLVIARAFQGIGAAFTIPPAQAHVALYFTEPAKKAKALGIWGAAGSLGFIIGLILGGVLTAFLGWRWIFWISLIISALVIPAAYLVLPRPRSSDRATTPPPSDDEPANAAANDVVPTAPPPPKKLLHSLRERLIRFDAVGIALGVPGILLLTYALTSANAAGWGTPAILAPLCVSVALLACFARHERRAPQAILAPHLFRSPSFNLTLLLAVLTYAVRQACTYFLTVQLQREFGLGAVATSVRFVPLGVSALVCNTLSGRLVPVLGARAMFVLGWLLATPGVALFALTTPQSSYWRSTLPGSVLYIAGIGAVYIAANVVVVSGASRSDQGAAAGVFNVALQEEDPDDSEAESKSTRFRPEDIGYFCPEDDAQDKDE